MSKERFPGAFQPKDTLSHYRRQVAKLGEQVAAASYAGAQPPRTQTGYYREQVRGLRAQESNNETTDVPYGAVYLPIQAPALVKNTLRALELSIDVRWGGVISGTAVQPDSSTMTIARVGQLRLTPELYQVEHVPLPPNRYDQVVVDHQMPFGDIIGAWVTVGVHDRTDYVGVLLQRLSNLVSSTQRLGLSINTTTLHVNAFDTQTGLLLPLDVLNSI